MNNIVKLGNDRTEKWKETSVIYKFNCDKCSSVYVGETKRCLKTRINEHKSVHARHGRAPTLGRRSHGLPGVRAKPRGLLALFPHFSQLRKALKNRIRHRFLSGLEILIATALLRRKKFRKKLRSDEGWTRTCDPRVPSRALYH